MLSFYQKLSSRLNEVDAPPEPAQAPAKSVSFKGTGERVAVPAPAGAPAAAANANAAAAQAASQEPPKEQLPEGAEPLDVDLFQSDARMVLFFQIGGVAKEDVDLVIDEEANTVTVQVTQKRPTLPPIPGAPEGNDEKGRYAKQEIKWRTLYRKVYLPAAFDPSEASAVSEKGVLVVVLPSKKPGAGKKLAVKALDEK
ncbi:MAG TPA: Hsp20/alpha crystallin family protein [Candidatus Paceibacterota bacterium]|nr:Hsp20/alpha crystallin family protein [Candidatus Paceibacterota bacterium]